MKLNRRCVIGLALCAVGLLLAGCTPWPGGPAQPPASRTGSLRLLAYDSCDAALSSLKAAARLATTQGRAIPVPAGRQDGAPAQPGAARAGAPGAAAGSSPVTTAPDYSGTNVHELGVDEPDMVKTDGTRIVTVANGVLHVVDAASHRVTGDLLLPGRSVAPAELLLRGDRALVLFPSSGVPMPMTWGDLQPFAAS